MADHPNAQVIRRTFEAFGKGDIATLSQVFADDAVWHMPGKGPFSGEHRGRDVIFAAFGTMAELSGGTFKVEVHDVVANDEHAVAILSASGSRQGKSVQLRATDVFHVGDGKIKEFWSFTEDQRIDDEFWS